VITRDDARTLVEREIARYGSPGEIGHQFSAGDFVDGPWPVKFQIAVGLWLRVFPPSAIDEHAFGWVIF
jgi:hypothetical protein